MASKTSASWKHLLLMKMITGRVVIYVFNNVQQHERPWPRVRISTGGEQPRAPLINCTEAHARIDRFTIVTSPEFPRSISKAHTHVATSCSPAPGCLLPSHYSTCHLSFIKHVAVHENLPGTGSMAPCTRLAREQAGWPPGSFLATPALKYARCTWTNPRPRSSLRKDAVTARRGRRKGALRWFVRPAWAPRVSLPG